MSLTYDYYPRVLSAINFISQGKSKTEACDSAGVSIPTFEEYVARDRSLETLYVDAERRGYDAMADALLTVTHNNANNIYAERDPKLAKIQSDNIKWYLEKKDNKRFGQRIEHQHTITADRAITDALDAARQRATAPRTIDGEVVSSVPMLGQGVVDVVIDDEAAILAQLLGDVG